MRKIKSGENAVYIGIGGCGVSILEYGIGLLPTGTVSVAVNRDEKSLHKAKGFKHKLPLVKLRITGSHLEYSEEAKAQVQASLDIQKRSLNRLLKPVGRVVVMSGLGGVVGSWATLIICNQLIEQGKAVDLVLVKPFVFEKNRIELAEHVLPLFPSKINKTIFHNDSLVAGSFSLKESFDKMYHEIFESLKD